MNRLLAVASVGFLAACSAAPARGPAVAAVKGIPRLELRTRVVGLSGLALGPGGRLWAVAEKQHLVLPLSLTGVVGEPLSVSGLDRELDLEAAAWLPGSTTWNSLLAVGLESPRATGVTVGSQACDVGLFSRSEHGGMRRQRCLAFPYKLWGVTPQRNRGIEGLCRAGPLLVAALETPLERGDQRLSALGVYHLERKSWQGHTLLLSSGAALRGKLSALECRPGPGGAVEAWAIERHFEVARLLHFTLPARPVDRPLRPTVVRDLRALLGDLNFEGLALLPDGRMVLLNDNFYGRRRGPSMLVLLPSS